MQRPLRWRSAKEAVCMASSWRGRLLPIFRIEEHAAEPPSEFFCVRVLGEGENDGAMSAYADGARAPRRRGPSSGNCGRGSGRPAAWFAHQARETSLGRCCRSLTERVSDAAECGKAHPSGGLSEHNFDHKRYQLSTAPRL